MTLPDFASEKLLWKKGFKFVCGIDEVGRGCFAGPIYAGAVVFEESKTRIMNHELRIKRIKIHDSKRLRAKKRETTAKWIKENALAWGVGVGSVAEINKLGIVRASQIAFRKAIAKANLKLKTKNLKIEYLLIDAFYIPYVKGLKRKNQKAIVKGDTQSISIAAASILAKVERDAYMDKISDSKEFIAYKWNINKGYGTKAHREAIKKLGTTKHHRKLFVETFLKRINA